MSNITLPIGSYATAKPGTTDEEGRDISRFGGRVERYYPEFDTYELQLDAPTLRSYTEDYVRQMDDEGLNLELYVFDATDLTPSPRRDTDEDLAAAREYVRDLIPDEEDTETAYFREAEQLRKEFVASPASPAPDPYRHLGRNDRVTVSYPDGTRKEGVKFKYVAKDLREGRCELG
jgi:hypothetical protein